MGCWTEDTGDFIIYIMGIGDFIWGLWEEGEIGGFRIWGIWGRVGGMEESKLGVDFFIFDFGFESMFIFSKDHIIDIQMYH
jgi:hypothetical protein